MEILPVQNAQLEPISLVKDRVTVINVILELTHQIKLQFNEFIESLDFISLYMVRLIDLYNALLEHIQIEDIMDIERIALQDTTRINKVKEDVKYDYQDKFQI